MEAYILEAVRTPRGAAKKTGSLRDARPVDLLTTLFHALEERGVRGDEVDDVLLGCSTQVGDQGADIAKIAAIYAGFGPTASGATLNRFCASGLDAVSLAAAKVASGMEDLVVAGGVESLSRVPMMSDRGAWFSDADVAQKTGFIHMGVAADRLATAQGFSRGDLDAFALSSHEKAQRATRDGLFQRSLVPVHDQEGTLLLDRDEWIREGLTMEKLAALPPAFAEIGAAGADAIALSKTEGLRAISHLHTAASSPGIVDGASLVAIGTREKAASMRLRVRARVRSFANVGVDPIVMLTGGVAATKKALAKAGLDASAIDRFEVNESFSAVPLSYIRALELDPARVNTCGGAIAMGHPLGATGGMLIATLLDELERQDGTLGVIAMCAGAGIGAAMVIERV